MLKLTKKADYGLIAMRHLACQSKTASSKEIAERYRIPLPLLSKVLQTLVRNGLLVSAVGMQPIIATLILVVAGRGIAQLITGGQIITVYYAPYFFIGSGYLLGLPFALFIAAAVFVGLLWLTRRTARASVPTNISSTPSAILWSAACSRNYRSLSSCRCSS